MVGGEVRTLTHTLTKEWIHLVDLTNSLRAVLSVKQFPLLKHGGIFSELYRTMLEFNSFQVLPGGAGTDVNPKQHLRTDLPLRPEEIRKQMLKMGRSFEQGRVRHWLLGKKAQGGLVFS